MTRTRQRRRGRRLRAAVFAAVAVAGLVAARPALAVAATPAWRATVAVVAAPGTRLADELARELEASRFEVVRVEVVRFAGPPRGAPWPSGGSQDQDDALRAVPPQVVRGVLVAPDDRRVTVFARLDPGGELHTRIDLQVDPRDRLVRRRACLAVVEYLRVMSAPPTDAASPPAPAGPASEAPAPRPLRAAEATPPPSGAATGAIAAAESAVVKGIPVSHRRLWIMGVAATLDLDTALGTSTGDLRFVWQFRVGPHVSLEALMLWPLVGASFQRGGANVRLWNFGTGVGVHYVFVEPPAPVRPFVGVTLGTRLTLTETTTATTVDNDSATAFTPSLNLGLQAGLACRISRFAELFLDSGATRDRLVPGLQRTGVLAAAANALSFNSALGVMLEY